MTETRLISEIIWREDLYPRFEPIPSRIQQYAESIELLPPIEINQRNEMIDGYHRWTAHKKAELEIIKVTVTHTKNDIELDRLMAKRNADGRIQLSQKEKQRKVRQWYTDLSVDKQAIADDLSIPLRTVNRWLLHKAKDLKAEREREIAEMWLACYTEDEIAEIVGVDQKTVNNLMSESGKITTWQKFLIFSTFQDPKWNLPLYDIWKVQSKSNETSHPGNSEAQWTDNLLYMYTEPFDIIVDPFAGGGSTIDVCRKRLRRYWASDRLPVAERRDIRQWDILDGPPSLHKRWGSVKLMYLDPPYWKQMEGKYSDDPQDLANMGLEEFYRSLTDFILACGAKMHSGSHIAMLMQPTQWKAPDRQVIDHTIDLISQLRVAPLKYVRRISCPYNTQQYSPQQVEWAKESRDVLVLTREITIWQIE